MFLPKGKTYSLIISAGKLSGTSSNPTSRHDSANSSTAPEHWHPFGSHTEQICRADAPYEPNSRNSLSYSSLASFSESIDDASTMDSRMPDDNDDGVVEINLVVFVAVVAADDGGNGGGNVETIDVVVAAAPTAPARIRCTPPVAMHNTNNRTTVNGPENTRDGRARFAIPRICSSFARHLAEHLLHSSQLKSKHFTHTHTHSSNRNK